VAAESYLKDGLYMRPDKRKEILDAESARIILERWLAISAK
jgi:RNase H-fold protein (predicted Holliday junction resolvase)